MYYFRNTVHTEPGFEKPLAGSKGELTGKRDVAGPEWLLGKSG